MNDNSRKILDSSFRKLAVFALALMCAAVAAFTVPILVKGVGAFAFTATSEHEKFLREYDNTDISSAEELRISKTDAAKKRIFDAVADYESKTSAEAENALNKKLSDAFEKWQTLEPELLAAAKLPVAERTARLSELSKSVWGGFSQTLEAASKTAVSEGAAISFEKFLGKLAAEIPERAKKLSAKISKNTRLSFGAKSAIRRALSAATVRQIEAETARLAELNSAYFAFEGGVRKLLGPRNAAQKASEKLPRNKYGQTRYDMAKKVFADSVEKIRIRKVEADGTRVLATVKTSEFFANTPVEKILEEIDKNFDALTAPHFVFYFGFFTDDPIDANIFGGIFPMIAGTFYLTLGAMLISAPLGIIAAIYFSEYAKDSPATAVLRMCVGTLAGVPSIIFGLFGLAFLINTVKISDGKSVLAGAVTLSLLILPTIIQSCVESLKSVPNAYREASYGLGAGKWKTICSVILPAALPSMLTGIIISMGRAAGETAPIIFTAATSTGVALGLGELFSQPTPALPWSIYNICSEHEAAEMVEYVQYGMVFTLMAIVLSLNLAAIIIRAKLQKR